MAEAPEQDDKTEEATQKRLDDARAKGDIIYSQEATAWFMLAAATLVLSGLAGPMSRGIADIALPLLQQPHAYAADGASLIRLMGALGGHVLMVLGLAALALAAAGLVGRFVQDAPVWSAERMQPKLERINPIEGFKRTFGPIALGNFAKGIVKLIVVGAALLWVLWPEANTLESLSFLDVGAFWALLQEKSLALMIAVLIAFGALAALDYVMTRQSYMRRQRMTRTEVKDEFRQTEGDPLVKMKLRQIRQERAGRRMMQKVPDATVIITNPTHYAVALLYDRETAPTPICVAKGIDDVALLIRETGEEAGVPLVENPPLARALYASADLDQPIPREHFEAVAKVISVVLKVASRRRPQRQAAASPNGTVSTPSPPNQTQ
jgi:flagellar biosynthetic protein FlhB